MKLKIYLFRHAQTYYNRDFRFTGWKDSKLTPLGIKQAKNIAKKLKNKNIDLAYQTHLSRSKDTLKEVLKFHPECREIITDDRMIERSYGKLQGHSHKWYIHKLGEKDYNILLHRHKIDHLHGLEREEFEKNLGEQELQAVRRSYDMTPPGGESVKMVEKRVNTFIRDLIKLMKKEKVNVALSAHGNSMRPFRKRFEHLSKDQMMRLENPWDDYFEYTLDV